MTIRPVTHARLEVVAERWRRQQAESESLVSGDPTGRVEVIALVYRQCANDLELALRDDVTLQPKSRR